MKYDVITIGGATEDISIYTDEGIVLDNKKDVLRQKLIAFEYGAKIRFNKSFSSFGGGASNAAVNFSNLGLKTAIFTNLGNDYMAKKLIDNFKDKGVSINLVKQDKKHTSPFSVIVIGKNNEHFLFSNRASNNFLEVKNSDLKKLKETKYIYISSLSGKWMDILNKVFSIKNIKIVWNPGNSQLESGKKIFKFLKKTYVLMVNKDEAIELVLSNLKFKKKGNKFLNNTKNLLTALKDIGPEIVVITDGKKGVDVYDGQEFYHQDIIKEKKLTDTTGVGDAFNSSFTAGMMYGKGIEESMKIGVKNTASVISKQGAQNGLLTKKQLKI